MTRNALSPLSVGQWARCLQAGGLAYGEGRPSSACPHSLRETVGVAEQHMAGAWLRGWTMARLAAVGGFNDA